MKKREIRKISTIIHSVLNESFYTDCRHAEKVKFDFNINYSDLLTFEYHTIGLLLQNRLQSRRLTYHYP